MVELNGTADAVEKQPQTAQEVGLQEIGSSGLKESGGLVHEEFLRDLQNEKGRRVFNEMSQNDPVIAGLLFAIEMPIRETDWGFERQNDNPADVAAEEFLTEAKQDMSMSWADLISEILSFLTFGWAYFEVVYKRRQGPKNDPRSQFSDGRIGWRKLALRSQDTLWKWQFDESGGLQGMVQRTMPKFQEVFIPIQKSVLFRTRTNKGNPEGRALDLDTPIPTPDGWRRMAELSPGDRIFDEAGEIRYVTGAQIWENRPVYCLAFSDGSEILADENHLWETQTAKERAAHKASGLRTTKEIFESSKARGGELSNHSIAWAKPLNYVAQNLLIDPYLLGYWLGDGHSRTGAITTHVDDAQELVDYANSLGYNATKPIQNGKAGGLGRLIRIRGELRTQLRMLNLLQNKHVPKSYLQGSYEQRLGLLQGLMDSDGTVDSFGRCMFTNLNQQLIGSVAELVRSLGMSCRISTKKARPEQGRPNDSYHVKFTPTQIKPFRLARKANQVKDMRTRENHYINKVEFVGYRSTKCIEVNSPSHMYLAGPSMVPTHNSILRSAYRAWYFKKNLEMMEAISLERMGAGFPVIYLPEQASAKDLASAKDVVRKIRVDEQMGITFPGPKQSATNPNGWLLELVAPASSRGVATGFSEAIARYRSEMLMSVVASFIALGTQAVGSFALSRDQRDFFQTSIEGWMSMISDTFDRFVSPPLLELNGMMPTEPIRLVHTPVGQADLRTISTFLASSGQLGFLTPTEDTEQWLRTALGAPPLKDGEREEADRMAVAEAITTAKNSGVNVDNIIKNLEAALEGD